MGGHAIPDFKRRSCIARPPFLAESKEIYVYAVKEGLSMIQSMRCTKIANLLKGYRRDDKNTFYLSRQDLSDVKKHL